jgi:hypothetical protein
VPPELRKYSLDTGLTQTICRVRDYFGGAWRDDQSIVFVGVQPQGLWVVPAAGGEPRPLVPTVRIGGADVQRVMAWPELLPGGRSAVVTDWEPSTFGSLAVLDFASRELTPLGLEGAGARLLPNGYLVYGSTGAALTGVRFDVRTRQVAGTPVALIPEIALGRGQVPTFAFDSHGTVVFATGYLDASRRQPMRIVRATVTGEAAPPPFGPDLFHRGFALSHDGSRLAVTMWDGSRWVLDLVRGTRTKLPSTGSLAVHSLAWSRDDRQFAFSGPKIGASVWAVFAQNADGSGPTTTLLELPAGESFVAGWTPDDRGVVTWGPSEAPRGSALWLIRQGERPAKLLNDGGMIRRAAVSPDGRWVAFDSLATSGDEQVAVVPLTGRAGPVAVTARGGFPEWSHDGRQLFFRAGRAVKVVDVTADGTGIHVGHERTLFEWDALAREYAVSPRGEFYGLEPVPGTALQRSLHLRTNWFAEVERLIGGGREAVGGRRWAGGGGR